MQVNEIASPFLVPGTMLGKYQIVRHLGSGGMGAVYEGIHTEIGKSVAIKTLNPEIAAMPGARARFLREAQLTSRVRHPHIVDVTDVGNEGGHAFLVMELLSGEDLAGCIARQDVLTLEATADIMVPICGAIDAAHAQGIIHRDLKPQNIFLAQGAGGAVPKVLDFGISKNRDLAGSALTTTGAIVGTPYYLPPELVKDGRAASAASDQYAIGIILYECLTGLRPYDGPTIFAIFQSVVSAAPVALRQLRPDLPEAVEQLIARGMHPDASGRFESVLHLAQALLPFAAPWTRYQWEPLLAQAQARAQARPRGEAIPPPSLESPLVGPTPFPVTPAGAFAGTTPLPPFAGGGGPSKLGGRAVGETAALLPALAPAPASAIPGGHFGRSPAAGGSQPGWSDEPQPSRTPRGSVRRPASGASWDRPTHGPSPSRAPWIMGIALLAAGAAGAFFLLPRVVPRGTHHAAPDEGSDLAPARRQTDPAPARHAAPAAHAVPFELEVEPAEASIELDGGLLGSGHASVALTLGQDTHVLRVSAPGYEEKVLTFVNELPPSRLTLMRNSVVVPKDNQKNSGKNSPGGSPKDPGSSGAKSPKHHPHATPAHPNPKDEVPLIE